MNFLKTLSACAALLFIGSVGAQERAAKLPAERQILFLGDSITQAGSYIAFFELYLWDQFPEADLDIVNLGLSSETASGNEEPDHPYPRPVIHERLGRILDDSGIDPDLVFFDYGMNDGIYHPFSTDLYKDYRDGIDKLVERLQKDGRRIVPMTPTPFDLVTKRKKAPVAPDASPGLPFGYKNTYYGYDQVLMTYGRYVRSLSKESIDLHTPMVEYVRKRRAVEPGLLFGDGVHPPVEGHLVMTLTILDALGYDRSAAEKRLTELTGIALFPTESDSGKGTALWQKMLKRKSLLTSAWLEHIGHIKPNKSKTAPLAEVQPVADQLEKEIREELNQKKR